MSEDIESKVEMTEPAKCDTALEMLRKANTKNASRCRDAWLRIKDDAEFRSTLDSIGYRAQDGYCEGNLYVESKGWWNTYLALTYLGYTVHAADYPNDSSLVVSLIVNWNG